MLRLKYFCSLLLTFPLFAQSQLPASQSISVDQAIDLAQKNNVLTFQGSPFHVVLEIEAQEKGDPAFKSHIDLFWEDRQKYRLVLESRTFGQTLIVNNGEVSETDRGDFYPSWLHAFVTALLDPIPRAQELRENNYMVGGVVTNPCFLRDDRSNGISDPMTWAQVCFSGDERRLQRVMDFTYNMSFSDFRDFGSKDIARTYVSRTGADIHLRGTMTTLEAWKPDESLLSTDKKSSSSERVLTKFVSTATEESMLESAPKDIAWPSVRDGKTEGYMLVHAITDRTGQVREASSYSSDNPGVEDRGRAIALQYKFKPLVVDGVPQQMEMPLAIHFVTRIENPIPELDDLTSRKIIRGCSLPHEMKDSASSGHSIVITIQVSVDGKFVTAGSSDRHIPVLSLFRQFEGCRFGEYKLNGEATAYHANLTVTAR